MGQILKVFSEAESSKEKNVITIDDKEWYVDVGRLEELCFKSENENGSSTEITEGYEKPEGEDALKPVNKIIREIKTTGNSQNDTMRYDLYKMFLAIVLNKDEIVYGSAEEDAKRFFNFNIAFHTLVKYGILKELNKN